jgi:hypothetical protein
MSPERFTSFGTRIMRIPTARLPQDILVESTSSIAFNVITIQGSHRSAGSSTNVPGSEYGYRLAALSITLALRGRSAGAATKVNLLYAPSQGSPSSTCMGRLQKLGPSTPWRRAWREDFFRARHDQPTTCTFDQLISCLPVPLKATHARAQAHTSAKLVLKKNTLLHGRIVSWHPGLSHLHLHSTWPHYAQSCHSSLATEALPIWPI